MRRALPFLLVLAVGACSEQLTAPGACPNFCPGDSVQVRDTTLTAVIGRDTSFIDYLMPWEAEWLTVADIPGVIDSRAIFKMNALTPRVAPNLANQDTTTVPIDVDSSRLSLSILKRDTNTANLWIKVYRLPPAMDSTTTFDSVAAAFNAPALDSVNLDSLLARPVITDTAVLRQLWNDPNTPVRYDSAGHLLQVAAFDSSLIVHFILDTLRLPFDSADSGRVAFGVRVKADSLASIALGANDVVNRDPVLRWYYHYPSDTTTIKTNAPRETIFDSFVFDPPQPTLDSAAIDTMLVVGGAPSVRSLVRVSIPQFLRDSADVVRATLLLVPVAAVPGAVGDSFTVVARPVITDLGAKSPLLTNSFLSGSKIIHLNRPDTVHVELTDMIRSWAADTSAATAFVLGQIPEAASYTQIRFYSSRASAFKPALRITYVPHFKFGAP